MTAADDDDAPLAGPELLLYRHFRFLACPAPVDPVDTDDCAGMAVEVLRFLRAQGVVPMRPGEAEGDPMPVFVIQAKDRLALTAVGEYRQLCLDRGLDDQAAEVLKALDEMLAWRHRNPNMVELPDHAHVPARPSTPEGGER